MIKKCLVLCSQEDIIWVVGHRVDERYKLVGTQEKGIYLSNQIKLMKYIINLFLLFPLLLFSQIEDPVSWSFNVENLGNDEYKLVVSAKLKMVGIYILNIKTQKALLFRLPSILKIKLM